MDASQVFVFVLILFTAEAARTRKPFGVFDCDTKGCSHQCETVGEFPLCVCPQNLVLDQDGKTCKESTSFLLAMFRGIRLLTEGSEEAETLAQSRVGCLDYHFARKEVIAYTNNTIMRYPISKGGTASSASTVIQVDTAATSIAVDWVHDIIYYISEQQLALSVTSLEGTNQQNILNNDDSSSAGWRNLAVDPHAKKLFWIGRKGVYSSDLEGKGLRSGLISWIEPDRIALDTSSQVIYAIGRRGGSGNKFIVRASYNGTKAGQDLEVLQPANVGIFGFGVVGNTAYWESNHDGENIYKCNLQGETNLVKSVLLAELNQIVYDMKVYDERAQKPSK